MKLLQNYLRKQSFWPLVITLSSLSILAILTQSLTTLDLIVENRQSIGTFFFITMLTIPQLVAVILPITVFITVLYTINRLNTDSELTVSKASGLSPWGIANPIVRLSVIAAILHLMINLAVQPAAFRQMRTELLKVKTDLASRLVRVGEFSSPVHKLTLYAKTISSNGSLEDVIIHDARIPNHEQTYISASGQIISKGTDTRLELSNGHTEKVNKNGLLTLIEFDTYSIDLTDVIAVDSVLRFKSSDRYLHELLHPDPREYITEKSRLTLIAEGHARLSAPLYNIALALLALCFLIRGELQRTGYAKTIALCFCIGFTCRISGYVLTSAAETNIAMNIMQYVLPAIIILVSLSFIFIPWRIVKPQFLRSKLNLLAFKRNQKYESPTL